MWIDDDGVAHTVAIPDVANRVHSDFAEKVSSWIPSRLEELSEQLFAYEDDVLDAVGADDGSHQRAMQIGKPIPDDLVLLWTERLSAQLGTAAAVLDSAPLEWRLDIVLLVQDYLNEQVALRS